jgi:hypothetical protein
MNSLMEQLLDAIKPHRVLHFRLFEVRFLTTKRGESVIVLIYHIALVDDEWKAAANILSKSLNATIVGRCRGKMLVTDCPNGEIITETLSINGRNFTYFQTEGAFSQPNAGVCEKMIEWALDVTAGSHDHDLLELYCGGGTFTAPLSQVSNKIINELATYLPTYRPCLSSICCHVLVLCLVSHLFFYFPISLIHFLFIRTSARCLPPRYQNRQFSLQIVASPPMTSRTSRLRACRRRNSQMRSSRTRSITDFRMLAFSSLTIV